MSSRGLDLPLGFVTLTYFAAGIVLATTVAAKLYRRSHLHAIPTVGSSGWLGSWWAGFTFPTNGIDVIREGYEKYKHKPFKVGDHYRWLVILSGREHMDEVQRAPEKVFSFGEAMRDRMSSDYTLGEQTHLNHNHVPVILLHLARNIGTFHSVIREEVVASFEEILNLNDNEWQCVPALATTQKVVFRTMNRVFVGLPLCRDPDWMAFNIQNAYNIIGGMYCLQRFPAFLAPLISLFIPNFTSTIKQAVKYVGPIIEERRQLHDKYGHDSAKIPMDFLSRLMEAAKGEEQSTECLTARLLTLIFGGIHTTAESFTHALLFLATRPECIPPLREEVEAIVSQEGWSKSALDKMRKLDSFLKENQRLKGTAGESLIRKALQDFTFSDGTFIPKGTIIAAPSSCLHLDDTIYENAARFDPFRFSKMREANGESTKHQFVTTSLDYLPFGHGKNACPGRFFAANLMKTMLAHIILTYDVKLEENAGIPESVNVLTSTTVNPNVKIMFRRRN